MKKLARLLLSLVISLQHLLCLPYGHLLMVFWSSSYLYTPSCLILCVMVCITCAMKDIQLVCNNSPCYVHSSYNIHKISLTYPSLSYPPWTDWCIKQLKELQQNTTIYEIPLEIEVANLTGFQESHSVWTERRKIRDLSCRYMDLIPICRVVWSGSDV